MSFPLPDTTKTDMRHARVRRAALSRAGSISGTVRIAAQEGAAALRAPLGAGETRRSGGIDDHPLAREPPVMGGIVEIGAPFPDVARHVGEAVAVERERADGRRRGVAVVERVAVRE